MGAQSQPQPQMPTQPQARPTVSLKAVMLSLVVLLANIVVNGAIFLFFRDSTLNPPLTAVLAVLWGVLGVYLIYYTLTWAVEQYPDHIRRKVFALYLYWSGSDYSGLVTGPACTANIIFELF